MVLFFPGGKTEPGEVTGKKWAGGGYWNKRSMVLFLLSGKTDLGEVTGEKDNMDLFFSGGDMIPS